MKRSFSEERNKSSLSELSCFKNILNTKWTSDAGFIRLTEGNETPARPLKVGVLFSGGPAAGGHNVVCGLFRALKKIHPSSQCIGLKDGPSGLIENKSFVLDEPMINKALNTGGFDLLGTGRTKIETAQQFASSLKVIQEEKLDGLVIVGGDDSNTNAFLLDQYLKSHNVNSSIIGVPKTIDGDLKSTHIETSFGFDTASKVYSEVIGNICIDAKSSLKYWHMIKLMGRTASHIALECSLQTHPNITLISEEIAGNNLSLEEVVSYIANVVDMRSKEGKQYGVALIPEGAVEAFSDVKKLIAECGKGQGIESLSPGARSVLEGFPEEFREGLLKDRDNHGNVQVSLIETEKLISKMVGGKLKKMGSKAKYLPLHHFFGYEGRCAYPSIFDATYCYHLGYTAALLIHHKKSGLMAGIKGLSKPATEWMPIGVELSSMMHEELRKGETKRVIKKALVDLKGPVYQELQKYRKKWEREDDYQNPGSIQFSGVFNDMITKTLALET